MQLLYTPAPLGLSKVCIGRQIMSNRNLPVGSRSVDFMPRYAAPAGRYKSLLNDIDNFNLTLSQNAAMFAP